MCLITCWTDAHKIFSYVIGTEQLKIVNMQLYKMFSLLIVAKEFKIEYEAKELKHLQKGDWNEIWEYRCKWLVLNSGDTVWSEDFVLWHVDIIYTTNKTRPKAIIWLHLFCTATGPGFPLDVTEWRNYMYSITECLWLIGKLNII